jgi:hypothetical protein
MRRLLPVAVAALALAPSAGAWAGKPSSPPPVQPMPGAPPPAWIETEARSAWLLYDSYCWRTSCVDLIPPETRPGLPVLTVVRGERVRVHFGFAATSATASIDRRKIGSTLDAGARALSWRATRAGLLRVTARKAGDASYAARIRFR